LRGIFIRQHNNVIDISFKMISIKPICFSNQIKSNNNFLSKQNERKKRHVASFFRLDVRITFLKIVYSSFSIY
jgi:hypothetical protein